MLPHTIRPRSGARSRTKVDHHWLTEAITLLAGAAERREEVAEEARAEAISKTISRLVEAHPEGRHEPLADVVLKLLKAEHVLPDTVEGQALIGAISRCAVKTSEPQIDLALAAIERVFGPQTVSKGVIAESVTTAIAKSISDALREGKQLEAAEIFETAGRTLEYRQVQNLQQRWSSLEDDTTYDKLDSWLVAHDCKGAPRQFSQLDCAELVKRARAGELDETLIRLFGRS